MGWFPYRGGVAVELLCDRGIDGIEVAMSAERGGKGSAIYNGWTLWRASANEDSQMGVVRKCREMNGVWIGGERQRSAWMRTESHRGVSKCLQNMGSNT